MLFWLIFLINFYFAGTYSAKWTDISSFSIILLSFSVIFILFFFIFFFSCTDIYPPGAPHRPAGPCGCSDKSFFIYFVPWHLPSGGLAGAYFSYFGCYDTYPPGDRVPNSTSKWNVTLTISFRWLLRRHLHVGLFATPPYGGRSPPYGGTPPCTKWWAGSSWPIFPAWQDFWQNLWPEKDLLKNPKKGSNFQFSQKSDPEDAHFDFLAETLNRKMNVMGSYPSSFKKV